MTDDEDLYPADGGEYLVNHFYRYPRGYITGIPGLVTRTPSLSGYISPFESLKYNLSLAIAADNTVYAVTDAGDLIASYTKILDRSGSDVLSPKWVFRHDVAASNPQLNSPVIAQNGDVYYVVENTLYAIAGNEPPGAGWPMQGRDSRHSSNACFHSRTDTDGDLMPDCYEAQFGLSVSDPFDAIADPDNDGLTNLQEFNLKSNPNSNDTDGDGLDDGGEISFGYNPLFGDSNDNGIGDLIEYQSYTRASQDGDANDDGQVNVADLLLLQRHVLGLIVLADNQKARLDLYPAGAPDNILNIQDTVLMHRLMMGGQ